MEHDVDSAAPITHGMGHDRVEPDWAILSLDDASSVFEHYPGIARPTALTWHSPRPFSSAAIAATPSGPIFIKRHHKTIRSVDGLAEEHRFIDHLRRAGAPVAWMLINDVGASVTALGDWVYELHRVGDGEDLYRDALSWSPFIAPSHAEAAGRALAELHRAATGFDAPPRSTPVLVSSFAPLDSTDLLSAIALYIEDRPALAAYLIEHDWKQAVTRTVLPFHRQLARHLSTMPPLWTHNDWHASNLLWRETDGKIGVSMIFDFGLCDRTTKLLDLAIAIERNCVDWLNLNGDDGDIVDWNGLDALLNGYESLSPLSAAEAEALIALLPIAHVPFALSEADYFIGILQAPAKADLAWDGYLLGHTEWFAGPRGQDLIQHLKRRWAGLNS